MRPDLVLYCLRGIKRRTWGVKDPLSLRYFQLAEAEYFILRNLDGQTTLQELRERFERQYRPSTLSIDELFAFVRNLHAQGLITAETTGQAAVLYDRREQSQRRKILGVLANPLAIRLPGVDPDGFLSWLAPRARWLFSPWFLVICCLLMLAASLLVAIRFDDVRSRLPELSQVWNSSNLVWLALALAATKIVHEMAHALTCKHFGGECHEMGVMLLAFTPCLYCNVSDIWTLPSVRQRVAVSAAGMFAECTLAAVCTFVWWASEPGLLHDLCLNLMLVASVSTLVFNGNPLLRYDGYFILSDLLSLPNLAERAATALRASVVDAMFGVRLPEQPTSVMSHRGLVGYAIASFAYRMFVIGVFAWWLIQWGKANGVEVLGRGASVVLVAMMAWPIVATVQTVTHPVIATQLNWRRFAGRGTAIALVATALFLVPLPHRVQVPAIIEASDARRLYVSVPGTLVDAVEPGTTVEAGQTIARLENNELAFEVEQLRGRRNEQRMQVKSLAARRVSDAQAAALLPAAEEALADVEQRLQQRLTDEARLTLTAPVAGTVLPPRSQHAQPQPGMLASWSGTPLDTENRRAYLDTGTQLCLVGDPNQVQASLLIDQADIEFVEVGQRVKLRLAELPGGFLEGTIDRVAETDSRVVPRELAVGGQTPATLDANGHVRPQNTSYHARVQLDPHDARLLLGTTGEAKIRVQPTSLGSRIYRYLSRTFRFEL
jgi:putative peptide zinc metalloprotease protein